MDRTWIFSFLKIWDKFNVDSIFFTLNVFPSEFERICWMDSFSHDFMTTKIHVGRGFQKKILFSVSYKSGGDLKSSPDLTI